MCHRKEEIGYVAFTNVHTNVKKVRYVYKVPNNYELLYLSGTASHISSYLFQIDPPGVFIENEVVFSFHQRVVTKVDRVYKVQCFYMEADKTINADVTVQ